MSGFERPEKNAAAPDRGWGSNSPRNQGFRERPSPQPAVKNPEKRSENRPKPHKNRMIRGNNGPGDGSGPRPLHPAPPRLTISPNLPPLSTRQPREPRCVLSTRQHHQRPERVAHLPAAGRVQRP